MKKWPMYYRLEGKTIVPVGDVEDLIASGYAGTWAKIDADHIGDVHVSTIFLGLDCNYSDEGPPILFETMVFGGVLDGEQWRYTTYDDALAGHAKLLAEVRASENAIRTAIGERIPEPHEE